jgi:HlyD family secretion protein
VRKGQVLVELDPALFISAVRREQANVMSARAMVRKARADLTNNVLVAERSQALADLHFAALADRDLAEANKLGAAAMRMSAKANVRVARAALERARLDLKNSVVLSPVDGVVIARNVELGQAVVSSFQAPNLYSIAQDLTQMQVLANVDEADIGSLAIGQKAVFTVDSYRGRRFIAEVAQIRNAPQTIQNVVTYVVVLNVDNRALLLKPGMTANVRVEVAREADALLVSNAALRFRPRLEPSSAGSAESGMVRRPAPEGAGAGVGVGAGAGAGADAHATVYVLVGKKLRPVHIVPGVSDGLVTAVHSGLQQGDEVVVQDRRTSVGTAAAGDKGRSVLSAAKGLKRAGM